MPKIAIIAFPGNNCEIESARAASRNGFQSEIIRWNQIKEENFTEYFKSFDAYLLPGGFSFEDRGRSGVISAREDIFDLLREEAQKGKVILGICNGAQMVVESGLIPVGENSLPFSLAHNLRRDETGHVLGTGFYNTWSYIKPERNDTAFTQAITTPIHIPIAHGEGRFTSIDTNAKQALASGSHVAYRYCDQDGNIDEHFPITPNGALSATAAITNAEGTIMAIMPHPERFFEKIDGDQVFQSIKKWIEAKKSPEKVIIGDFDTLEDPEITHFEKNPDKIYIEKSLIITDNTAFSIQKAAEKVSGKKVKLSRSVLFEITVGAPLVGAHGQGQAQDLPLQKLLETGLFHNQNKEQIIPVETENFSSQKFLVRDFQNDEADHLSDQLTEILGQEITVQIYTAWDFKNTEETAVDAILRDRLLCNPNAGEILIIE